MVATEGHSGPEIESAVVGSTHRSNGADRPMTGVDILAELEATVPLSVSRTEEMAALRAWAEVRAVAA